MVKHRIKHEENENEAIVHDQLPERHDDITINFLHHMIRLAVKVLSVLMVIVILWGTVDVAFVMYSHIMEPPRFLLGVQDMFTIFSSFMVILIAIEIFINIRLYLGTAVLPVQLVIATALMAIARKIIVLDVEMVSAEYLAAMGFVVIALGVTYWLIARKTKHSADKPTQKESPT